MDRFHLLQNLHKYMLGALQRLLPQRWDKITQETTIVASVTIDNNQQELPKLNPRQQKKRLLYAFVQYFRECINNYDSLSIQKLISSVKKVTIPEIKSFLNYLQKELQAILLSIHYKYSNGVIEGQINRLKTTKRMLYGRASFPLLKNRVLYRWQ